MIISLPVLWSRFISVINIQLNILNQYDGQSNWSKYLPLPGLFYLLLVEVSHPWSNKVVHKGNSPRASKLPCGESGFAIRENTDKTKKILEVRYENWFYLWFSYVSQFKICLIYFEFWFLLFSFERVINIKSTFYNTLFFQFMELYLNYNQSLGMLTDLARNKWINGLRIIPLP